MKAQQTASVNAVVTQQGTSVKAVQAQQTTSVNTVTAEGTKQVGLVSTEGTKQVDLAKAQVTLATQSASTATAKATIATQQATLATTKASEAEDSATAANADATKAKASATNAANSASTSTAQATNASNSAKAAKISADNAALSKTAAGTSETNAKASEVEAKKQADLAKGYADQAVAGQLQADWAQTNSTKNDFIKNKPTLGALASKDSIAYSEITGTPPEQDLSGLATKNELQTGLAGKASNADLSSLEAEVTKDLQAVNTALADKANSSHTHTVSQITDMPKVVLSVNNITPNGSGNVLVDVGAKTVEGKAPDGQGNIALGLHAVATSGSYNDLANKPSIPATPNAYVTKTWKSGTKWCRIWSDGWIEQGGHGTGGTCTFNKSFSNTNYTFNVQPSNEYTAHPDWIAAYELRSGRTTTKTSIAYYDHGDQGWDWRASGY